MDRFQLKHPVIVGATVLATAAALIAGFPFWKVLTAAAAFFLILRVGVLLLGGMARPIPDPPPAGELRKVKIAYRCDHCGAEMRMTISPTEDPEPPRHCQDDMVLLAPVDDI